MKGMKKTNNELRVSNACQIMNNMCTAPEMKINRDRKIFRKVSGINMKEVISIILMILGTAILVSCVIIGCLVEYYEHFSKYEFIQYVFNHRDELAYLFGVSGIGLFFSGFLLSTRT